MKLDINLIPGKSKDASKDFYKMIILILIFSFIIVIWGYVLPKGEKEILVNKVNKKEQELEELSEIEEEYNNLKTLRDTLKNELDLYDNIKTYKTKMTSIIKDFELLMPSSITMDAFNYNEGLISVVGTAPEYKDISQFMIKIRESEYVMGSSLGEVNIVEDEEGNLTGYSFTLNVALLNFESDDEEVVESEEVPVEEEKGGEE